MNGSGLNAVRKSERLRFAFAGYWLAFVRTVSFPEAFGFNESGPLVEEGNVDAGQVPS
jgi:hypothetical protein